MNIRKNNNAIVGIAWNARAIQFWLCVSVLLVLILGLFYLHMRTGFTYFTNSQLWMILLGRGTPEEQLTILDFRMVRSILAILIGIGLSLSGAIFQTVSHNELASPGLLGVNAGAGLAVMGVVCITPDGLGVPLWIMPVVAVLGAGIAALGIYALAYRGGQLSSIYTLVLNGITVTAGIHAVQQLLIISLSTEKFNQANSWLIGTIFGNSWSHVAILLPVVVLLSLYLFSQYDRLNLLALSDEIAIGLGVALNRERLLYLMIAVVLAATCVAVGGSIAFLGLICPHMARRLVGANHVYYLPITALLGAALLLGADWIARVIIAPDEMLVGTVVALIGAPYFLFLLTRSRV